MHTDSLLYQLYARPDDAGQWTAVLNQLCRETGARSAVLQAVKRSGSRLTIAWSAADSYTLSRDAAPPAGIGDADNPRLEARRFARGLNRVARDEELFDRDDPAQHRLHEQLAQRRLGRFMGSLRQLDDDTYVGLALHRAIDDPDDFSAAHASQLEMLAPHFGQAMALRARLSAGDELDRQLRLHADRMRSGLIVCDARAQVRWMNQRARALLQSSTGLQLRGGGLHAADAHLRRHIAELAAGAGGNRYLTVGEGRDSLHLALQAADDAGLAAGGASVLLAVTQAAADVAVPAAAIAALFGLTRAEASLVAGLVEGCSLEQYAQRRGVGLGTVRGQLKQVQAKTGATRQAELVRLVLSSAAAQLPEQYPA
ncbi:helix-turn-helix transcriptional regulator [Duganella radicis]|uniref:Helix-turn-helix transcriptional regulator n=1 Tax=Duganella radicis TaxID=551988 RepID=A0A6L6PAJ9_9BURK|nr:helix-turn-helix transcriptional regulator [Duganella radicis]MTV36036.1 helix-turn-helix transcriptional regulator [Duganella radicis]